MAGERVSDSSSVEEPNYPIASVDSALRLLLMLAELPRLRIADASRELGVARSTAHRLIKMLEYHGFARQDPDSKAYLAGPVLVNIGLQTVRGIDIRTVARPLLETLAQTVSETVNLAVLQGDEILILDSVESPRSIRIGSRTGRVMPAYASASGRALLATMSDERIREIYAEQRLPTLTKGTISSRKRLEAELAETRARGYAVQRGELEPDVAAIAAAVQDSRGQASFSITVAVPAFRLRDEDVPRIGEAVTACARDVSSTLPW